VHANYEYVLEKCRQLAGAGGPILDFGCGAGMCVIAGRGRGLDVVGADIFFEDYLKEEAISNNVLGTSVFDMSESRILPFENDHFDFVFCNMVFEHVADIQQSLKEIARVLKPGGRFLAVFPGKESFVEGHVRIPLIHWFAKDSAFRYAYMKLMRRLGFGAGGAGKSPSVWACDQLAWLDQYTFYRGASEISRSFEGAGFSFRHMEDDYISFRLAVRGFNGLSQLARSGPFAGLSRAVCRRLGAQVLLATKQDLTQQAKTSAGNELRH
jgi:SAM-dependent methyltransferase